MTCIHFHVASKAFLDSMTGGGVERGGGGEGGIRKLYTDMVTVSLTINYTDQ